MQSAHNEFDENEMNAHELKSMKFVDAKAKANFLVVLFAKQSVIDDNGCISSTLQSVDSIRSTLGVG